MRLLNEMMTSNDIQEILLFSHNLFKIGDVFKRYTSSKVHYFFDLKDFKERTNDEESLDDISLIVGQFSMTIFPTGYLHRLSDTQSCFCVGMMNLTVDNTENKRRRTQYIVCRARRSLHVQYNSKFIIRMYVKQEVHLVILKL